LKHSNDFSYDDALAFIHGAQKLGSKLGLTNIRALLERLGNPEKSLRFIHIAGTNGKGTVTSSLAAVLKAAGYRTGAYTSPFVYRFNERMQIDGEDVSDALLTESTEKVQKACKDMVEEGMAHPTEFEIVTAVAFLCYAAEKCDFVALEVGLGGRLDATNVIEAPLCTAINLIGFDHMQYLGNTLSEIAAEKCGILKQGVPAVIYREQPTEAMETIFEKCREKDAAMYLADAPCMLESTYRGNRFSAGAFSDLFLPLAGAHMAKNACVTLKIIEVLREKGISIPDSAVRLGFENTRHRGRFETVDENPLFILDGAHNEDGIKALSCAANSLFKEKKIVLICGMLRDKEYGKAMEQMAAVGEKMITVTVPSPRALPADDLCTEARKYRKNAEAAKSLYEAVEKAYAEKPDVIIGFGSLYMLGDLHAAQKEYAKILSPKKADGSI